eukprot:GHVR01079457.1.p2 GENE.GHVR01079457.1~~GHVR01079457.1.p2  ORF type:complete len:112 (-),score=23.77 GHVR01079457.1:760-1095(-)
MFIIYVFYNFKNIFIYIKTLYILTKCVCMKNGLTPLHLAKLNKFHKVEFFFFLNTHCHIHTHCHTKTHTEDTRTKKQRHTHSSNHSSITSDDCVLHIIFVCVMYLLYNTLK